jgi:hypothetical protein
VSANLPSIEESPDTFFFVSNYFSSVRYVGTFAGAFPAKSEMHDAPIRAFGYLLNFPSQ